MSHEMQIMNLNDEATYLKREGEIAEAKNLQKVILNKRNQQDSILEIFESRNWNSQKVIGSDDFINEKYRQWNLYKRSA